MWPFFGVNVGTMEHLRMQRASQGQRLSTEIRLWEAWQSDTVVGRNPAPVDRWFMPLFILYYIILYLYYIILYYIIL